MYRTIEKERQREVLELQVSLELTQLNSTHLNGQVFVFKIELNRAPFDAFFSSSTDTNSASLCLSPKNTSFVKPFKLDQISGLIFMGRLHSSFTKRDLHPALYIFLPAPPKVLCDTHYSISKSFSHRVFFFFFSLLHLTFFFS